jgi:hypothetical protein
MPSLLSFLQVADRDCWTLERLWNHGLVPRSEGFGTALSSPSAFWIASRSPLVLRIAESVRATADRKREAVVEEEMAANKKE